MLTDVLPPCRGSVRAQRQCGAWRERGGDLAPGIGGRWDPWGQGRVGIWGTTPHPWAVLLSRTASIHLHIPRQSEMPSAAAAPIPALLPPLVPHRAGRRSHLGCVGCSTVGTKPSSHPHPSPWHRSPRLALQPPGACGTQRNANIGGFCRAQLPARRGARRVGAGRFAGAECFSFQVTQAPLLLRG